MAEIDLENVCRRLGASVLRRCCGILGDADAAEDLAQEVFVTVLTKGHQFRGEAELSSWIYRVTTNLCLNRLRMDRRRRVREQASEVLRWERFSPADPYEQVEARARLAHLFGALDPCGQEIFVYRYLDGMTQEQIAQAANRSRRTVGKRLKRIEALLEAEEVSA